MAYRIENHKIISEILEVNIVDHCNLRCRSCAHLSPISAKREVNPVELLPQLQSLSIAYHANKLRLLGGEPLLHRNIDEIISSCRESGVADDIEIVTNGQLPERLSDKLLQAIDGLEISLYPGFGYKGNLEKIKELCRQCSCSLRVTEYNYFRESYSENSTQNYGLAQKVYDTCQITHLWGNHSVQDGYLYKCPHAHVVRRIVNACKNIPQWEDGISVFSENLFEYLKIYFENKKPLLSCKNCLGSAGKLFGHEQIERKKWAHLQEDLYEEMIDYDFLNKLQSNPSTYSGCYKDVYRSWD